MDVRNSSVFSLVNAGEVTPAMRFVQLEHLGGVTYVGGEGRSATVYQTPDAPRFHTEPSR